MFLELTDTIQATTWKVADAELALARHDTVRARMRVQRHYLQPITTEFTGEQGFIRSFAWGDVLSRLGEPRLAIAAFARLDSADFRAAHPGYLVRSYAERGAMYEQLHEFDRAIEYYQRFADAWKHADRELQPQVEQAQRRIQALRDRPAGVAPR